MNPLVQKILEAGLVDKHTTKMMERWGTLETGASDLVGQRKLTEESLGEFVEELSILLDSEPEMRRETKLDVDAEGPPFLILYQGLTIAAVKDKMGRYICNPEMDVTPGEIIFLPETQTSWYVDNIEELYKGEQIVAIQLTVRPVNGG